MSGMMTLLRVLDDRSTNSPRRRVALKNRRDCQTADFNLPRLQVQVQVFYSQGYYYTVLFLSLCLVCQQVFPAHMSDSIFKDMSRVTVRVQQTNADLRSWLTLFGAPGRPQHLALNAQARSWIDAVSVAWQPLEWPATLRVLPCPLRLRVAAGYCVSVVSSRPRPTGSIHVMVRWSEHHLDPLVSCRSAGSLLCMSGYSFLLHLPIVRHRVPTSTFWTHLTNSKSIIWR